MNTNGRLVRLALIVISSYCIFPTMAANTISIAVYAEHDKYVAASAPYGTSWKLIELAAQSQQMTIVLQRGPWKAGMKRLRAKKVDFIYPGFKTPEREKWALFTLPLLQTGSAIYTRMNNPINNVSEIDFNHVMVGVSANSVQEKLAREVGFKNIYSTGERNQFYSMLQENRLDYLFFSSGAVNYYCMYEELSHSRDCLKQVGDSYGNKSAHALSLNTAKSKRVMDKLNAGLIDIQNSLDVQELFKQYQYSEKDLQNWQASLTSN